MSKRILLVEDESGLVLTLTDRLESEGYRVESTTDGLTGLERARTESFDLIVLDVMLPGKSGFDVCRDLRQHGVKTPLIMLTARGQIVDRVLGLKLGADDYLTKPFEEIELLARIEALLRRSHAESTMPEADVYYFGSVKVNFRRAEVERSGQLLDLTAREFRLLCYFIKRRGEIITRDQLLDDVWGYNAMPTTRTVDVHIAGLRQKIEDNPSAPVFIHTVHGLGYKFLG